jgi:hypothetical protein
MNTQIVKFWMEKCSAEDRIGYLSITASETEQEINLRTPKERKFHIRELPKDA